MKIEEKYLMWVQEIDNEEKVVYATGHKIISEEEKSSTMFSSEFDFDWLKIMLADEYDEFMRLGRIFNYIETLEKGCATSRVELVYLPPLTPGQIEEAEKKAEEWAKNIDWE